VSRWPVRNVGRFSREKRESAKKKSQKRRISTKQFPDQTQGEVTGGNVQSPEKVEAGGEVP